jgi:hypothetical protein
VLPVPIYARATARLGSRAVTVASLIFFSSNVVLFCMRSGFMPRPLPSRIPGVVSAGAFYVW